MRSLDFSSWSGLLSTVLGLALITLLGVGIRLLVIAPPVSFECYFNWC
jgi:hypothetical protein